MDMKPAFQNEGLVKEFSADKLHVLEFENRDFLGRSAAKTVADLMRRVIQQKGKVRMVFASAMSQVDFLKYLARVS